MPLSVTQVPLSEAQLTLSEAHLPLSEAQEPLCKAQAPTILLQNMIYKVLCGEIKSRASKAHVFKDYGFRGMLGSSDTLTRWAEASSTDSTFLLAVNSPSLDRTEVKRILR